MMALDVCGCFLSSASKAVYDEPAALSWSSSRASSGGAPANWKQRNGKVALEASNSMNPAKDIAFEEEVTLQGFLSSIVDQLMAHSGAGDDTFSRERAVAQEGAAKKDTASTNSRGSMEDIGYANGKAAFTSEPDDDAVADASSASEAEFEEARAAESEFFGDDVLPSEGVGGCGMKNDRACTSCYGDEKKDADVDEGVAFTSESGDNEAAVVSSENAESEEPGAAAASSFVHGVLSSKGEGERTLEKDTVSSSSCGGEQKHVGEKKARTFQSDDDATAVFSWASEAVDEESRTSAVEFERKKGECTSAAEFGLRPAKERRQQALEREAQRVAARKAAMLERQRKEKEEADRKRRLASRAAFEERRKEAEEIKRKREDAAAKRKREQQDPGKIQQLRQCQHQPFDQQRFGTSRGMPHSYSNAYQQAMFQQHPHQQMPQTQQAHNVLQQQQSNAQWNTAHQNWHKDPAQVQNHQHHRSPRAQIWSAEPSINVYGPNNMKPLSSQQHQPQPQPNQTLPTPSIAKVPVSPRPVAVQKLVQKPNSEPKTAMTTEEVRRSILYAWALQPPGYLRLKPIGVLMSNLQVALPPACGVKAHKYFAKWTPMRYGDLCRNEDVLKRCVKKVRIFLHPDKLPPDLDAIQSFVCKLIWDVINDAWESHNTGVPI